MKIGVDIDGVLIDTINFVAGEFSRYLGYHVFPEDIAHRLEGIKEASTFFEQAGEHLLCSLPPLENAVTVLNELGNEHEIYCISARYNMHYPMTLQWFERHGFQVHKIIFTNGKSKVEICQKIGLDLFIEDSAVNAEEIATLGIPVIIFDTEYNQTLTRLHFIRCHTWKEIQAYFQSLFTKASA